MKKTKLIALTMVVALMMVGAGYAAWTDTLTINQEVHTGQLDVHFVDAEVLEVDNNEYTNAYVSYSRDYEGGQNDWDKANIVINDAYPGSKYNVKLQLKNDSTMPVKVADLPNGISNNAVGIIDQEAFDYIKVSATGLGSYTLDPVDPDQFNSVNNYIIPVGSTMEIEFAFETPDDVLENTQYKIWIQPQFEQFNK